MATSSGRPYPHQVGLHVSFENLSAAKAREATLSLRSLRGWVGGLSGPKNASYRYEYGTGTRERLIRLAAGILRSAGSAQPTVSAFTIWRIEYPLRGPLSEVYCLSMAAQLRALDTTVVAVQTNERRTLVTVDVRDEPTARLLGAIQAQLASDLA